jgi:hypothetical protein
MKLGKQGVGLRSGERTNELGDAVLAQQQSEIVIRRDCIVGDDDKVAAPV